MSSSAVERRRAARARDAAMLALLYGAVIERPSLSAEEKREVAELAARVSFGLLLVDG